MKVVFSILLFLSVKSFSQTPPNPLAKYSYLIEGVTIDDKDSILGFNQATGFFMKENSKMYFVTAKHVLSGFVDSCKRNPYAPALFNIVLHDENGKFIEFLQINFREVIDTTPCINPHLVPDFIMYQIDDFEKFNIFSIEKYLPFYIPKEPGGINVFGFPSSLDHDTVNIVTALRAERASNLKITNYQLQMYSKSKKEDGLIDNLNYRIITQDIIIDKSLKGYSGSPVFIEDKRLHTWIFTGIFSSTDITHSIYVVKPNNFIKE